MRRADAFVPWPQIRAAEHQEDFIRSRADHQYAAARGLGIDQRNPAVLDCEITEEALHCVNTHGVIDMAAEKKRLEKAIASVDSDTAKMDAKLNNPNFMSRAAPEAIEEAQERKAELAAQRTKLAAALKRVEGAA